MHRVWRSRPIRPALLELGMGCLFFANSMWSEGFLDLLVSVVESRNRLSNWQYLSMLGLSTKQTGIMKLEVMM